MPFFGGQKMLTLLLLAHVVFMRDAAVCVSGAGRDAEHTSTTYGPCRGPARPDAAPLGPQHDTQEARPGPAPPSPSTTRTGIPGSHTSQRVLRLGSDRGATRHRGRPGQAGPGRALALSADVFPPGRMTGTGGRRRTVGALISGQRLGLGRIRGGMRGPSPPPS